MTVPRLTAIERAPLWDQAYLSIKAALLAGRFAPGDKVVLRQVSDDLGISLTPVRDAVNRLIAERVLDRGGVGPGGAAIVPLLNADQFSQLMIVRAGLEPIAAEAAAAVATERQIDSIEECLLEMKKSVDERRKQGYLDAHYQFHFRMYELCRMPILKEVIESAWLRCGPIFTLSEPAVPVIERYESRYKHHVDVIEALRRHDGVAAAASVRADIENGRQEICALMDRAIDKPAG